MARQRKDHPRRSRSAQCSLCGFAFPLDLMVPDGGQACADIRWYCKDVESCTQRWTARLPGTGHLASVPSVGGPGPAPRLIQGQRMISCQLTCSVFPNRHSRLLSGSSLPLLDRCRQGGS